MIPSAAANLDKIGDYKELVDIRTLAHVVTLTNEQLLRLGRIMEEKSPHGN